MTAPQIGNTGVTARIRGGTPAFLKGFVVRELSPSVSNWRAEQSLDEWLRRAGGDRHRRGGHASPHAPAARRGRAKGNHLHRERALSDDDLVARARAWPGLLGVDLVQAVTCDEAYHWIEPSDTQWIGAGGAGRALPRSRL